MRIGKSFFVLLTFLFVAAAFSAPGQAHTLDVPRMKGPVNDLAGIMPTSIIETLDADIRTLRRDTGIQIAVLIIPSLEGENLEEFSIKTASTWALGEKGKDNGVLLLVAMQERKIRIETGYGLEDKLTDLLCGRIIREEMQPAFRAGRPDAGVKNGVGAIMEAVRTGAYAPSEAAREFAKPPGPAQQGSQRTGDEFDLDGALCAAICLGACALGFFLRRRPWWAACLAGAILGAGCGVGIAALPDSNPDCIWGGALVGFFLAWMVFGLCCWYGGIWEGVTSIWGGSSSSGSGRSSASSSSGGSYRGGGGRFGGGGASGGW